MLRVPMGPWLGQENSHQSVLGGNKNNDCMGKYWWVLGKSLMYIDVLTHDSCHGNQANLTNSHKWF